MSPPKTTGGGWFYAHAGSTRVEWYVSGIFSLLPIVNPIGAIPSFLSLTAHRDAAERRRVAFRAALFVFLILTTSLIGGSIIMEFFGISIPAVRIAGGMIIALIGFRMLFPAIESAHATDASMAGGAFIPLALPTMSGPGSIAVVIGMESEIAQAADLGHRLLGYTVIVVVILTIAGICLGVLRCGTTLLRFLGRSGVEGLTRIMGFLLVCIGIQFVATGIGEFLRAAHL